jgi:hypothetical protein
MKEHFRIIINDLRLRLVTIRQMKKKLNMDNSKDRYIIIKLKKDYDDTLELFIMYSMKRFNLNIRQK